MLLDFSQRTVEYRHSNDLPGTFGRAGKNDQDTHSSSKGELVCASPVVTRLSVGLSPHKHLCARVGVCLSKLGQGFAVVYASSREIVGPKLLWVVLEIRPKQQDGLSQSQVHRREMQRLLPRPGAGALDAAI